MVVNARLILPHTMDVAHKKSFSVHLTKGKALCLLLCPLCYQIIGNSQRML